MRVQYSSVQFSTRQGKLIRMAPFNNEAIQSSTVQTVAVY